MGQDKDEEIPSVRELEALEQKDRKETEDLLAGFDRPGRTPRRTPSGRDFVAYYSGREEAAPEAPSSSRREPTSAHDKPTVIVPRRTAWRSTMTWVLAVVGMVLFGATIAVLSTPNVPASLAPPPSTATPIVAPTSATTITSAIPQSADRSEETTNEAIIVAPPPNAAQKKTAPATAIGGASSPSTIKTAPRDDFIRDL